MNFIIVDDQVLIKHDNISMYAELMGEIQARFERLMARQFG